MGASDGKSLGYRPLETAQRLVANGFATPSYGRKGHLKAIWLRRLQMKDEDGVEFSTEPLFFTVLNECLVRRARAY
jgi:hypothetical protein